MPATYSTHDGLVDVIFSWPDNDIDTAQEVIEGAAKYLHDRGRGPTIIDPDLGEIQKPWVDLTNQEKLDIPFHYTTRQILEMAKLAVVDTDTEAARQAAIDYAETNYALNE
jgi:hypothetical protein